MSNPPIRPLLKPHNRPGDSHAAHAFSFNYASSRGAADRSGHVFPFSGLSLFRRSIDTDTLPQNILIWDDTGYIHLHRAEISLPLPGGAGLKDFEGNSSLTELETLYLVVFRDNSALIGRALHRKTDFGTVRMEAICLHPEIFSLSKSVRHRKEYGPEYANIKHRRIQIAGGIGSSVRSRLSLCGEEKNWANLVVPMSTGDDESCGIESRVHIPDPARDALRAIYRDLVRIDASHVADPDARKSVVPPRCHEDPDSRWPRGTPWSSPAMDAYEAVTGRLDAVLSIISSACRDIPRGPLLLEGSCPEAGGGIRPPRISFYGTSTEAETPGGDAAAAEQQANGIFFSGNWAPDLFQGLSQSWVSRLNSRSVGKFAGKPAGICSREAVPLTAHEALKLRRKLHSDPAPS